MAENMQTLDIEDVSLFTNEEVRAVDTAELDRLIADMRQAEADYEEAKKVSDGKFHIREQKRQLVLQTLVACGKSKYYVDGLGTASVIPDYSVPTPKTIEEKRQLFQYIRKTYNDDALMSLLSINYQSLNAFVKQELELHKEDPTFAVPGVGAPKAENKIRFTSERKKKA